MTIVKLGTLWSNITCSYNLSTGYITPERTKLNNSHKNANNKTWFPPLPVYTSGDYTSQDTKWDSGSHNVYDTSGSHKHSTDSSINLIGLKPGVSYNQMRVQVSIDVGKKVIRDLDKAFVSIADFHGKINSSYKLSQPSYSSSSRHLLHGFAEINTQEKPLLSDTNKESLVKVIHATGAGGGTPTATALTAAARYFLTG